MSVPSKTTEESVNRSIQSFIMQLPKDGSFEDSSDGMLSSSVGKFVNTYILTYLNEGPDAIDNYGEEVMAAATWMSYEETVDGKVLYNDKNILSYQVRIYSYTGGAHGNLKTYNGVFDFDNREPLTLSSVFPEERIAEVNEMLQSQLARQYDCESIEELSVKAQFFAPAEIEATENFYVDERGISWQFDPYDIAPYSIGEVVVTLDWTAVGELISQDSPLRAFL